MVGQLCRDSSNLVVFFSHVSKQIADAPARSIVGTPDWMVGLPTRSLDCIRNTRTKCARGLTSYVPRYTQRHRK